MTSSGTGRLLIQPHVKGSRLKGRGRKDWNANSTAAANARSHSTTQ